MPKTIDAENLFQTTVALFAARGYSACTTQAIAKAAGVAEATLFRRYGSKAKLIEAALAHCLPRSPFGQIKASNNALEDLTAILQAYAQTFAEYGGAVATLISEAPRHPELAGAVTTLLPNMMNAVGIIVSHQKAGRLSAGDPMQKLVLLLAPIMASGLFGRLQNLPQTMVFEPAHLAHLFLQGHAPA